jgi:hypothetical protein
MTYGFSTVTSSKGFSPAKSRIELTTPRIVLQSDRSLLQQAVDFDLTSGAEVDAAVDYNWDDEAGGQGRAVALAVLLGVVDRLAQLGCIEGIENGVFGIGAVPSCNPLRPVLAGIPLLATNGVRLAPV